MVVCTSSDRIFRGQQHRRRLCAAGGEAVNENNAFTAFRGRSGAASRPERNALRQCDQRPPTDELPSPATAPPDHATSPVCFAHALTPRWAHGVADESMRLLPAIVVDNPVAISRHCSGRTPAVAVATVGVDYVRDVGHRKFTAQVSRARAKPAWSRTRPHFERRPRDHVLTSPRTASQPGIHAQF